MQQIDKTANGVGTRALAILKGFDPTRLLALVLLIIYLPAIAAIALVVLFTSSGPAFVSRCYRRPDGRMVDLWEFRLECWRSWDRTPIGQCLWDNNLYRLPALVNVMRGDIGVGERVRAVALGEHNHAN